MDEFCLEEFLLDLGYSNFLPNFNSNGCYTLPELSACSLEMLTSWKIPAVQARRILAEAQKESEYVFTISWNGSHDLAGLSIKTSIDNWQSVIPLNSFSVDIRTRKRRFLYKFFLNGEYFLDNLLPITFDGDYVNHAAHYDIGVNGITCQHISAIGNSVVARNRLDLGNMLWRFCFVRRYSWKGVWKFFEVSYAGLLGYGEMLLKAFLLILLWYISSLCLSVYNKVFFGQSQLNFPFPLFSTSLQMGIQFLLSFLILAFYKSLPKIPSITFIAFNLSPCATATALDIGLSNRALESISLTLYTMVKSGAPVFVLLFAFVFGLEKPTVKLIFIILIICFGVALMVGGGNSVDFDLWGFINVQTATVLSGLRWSLTTILIKKGQAHDADSNGFLNGPVTTIYQLAPLMSITLFISACFVEKLPDLIHNDHFSSISSALYLSFALGSGGFLAFGMVLTEYYLISCTSVVTFSVAGVVKEIITIVAAGIIFGDKMTPLRAAGLAVSLIGVGLYNYVRIHHFDKEEDVELDIVESDDEEITPRGSGLGYVPIEISK